MRYFAIYLLFSFIKMRHFYREGRFWAEEGAIYYHDISRLSFWKSFLYAFQGANVEIITNITVFLSTLTSLQYAPLITTYISFILQSLPIILIIVFRENFKLSPKKLIAFLLIITGLPSSNEVWANTINLHFHFSLLAALIGIIKIPHSQSRKYFLRALLVIAGLGGIISGFVLPVFFAQALFTKEKERWLQFLILAISVSIPSFLFTYHILFNPEAHHYMTTNRVLNFLPLIYWLACVFQLLLAPCLGSQTGEQIANIFKEMVITHNFHPIWLVLICSLPFFAGIHLLRKTKSPASYAIIFSILLLTAISFCIALENPYNMMSGLGGWRYFYASGVLVTLFFFMHFNKKSFLCYFFLIILLANSAWNILHGLSGPSWKQSYLSMIVNHQQFVRIWPAGWMLVK